MRIAVEISMYPLQSDYEPSIVAFIEELKASGLSTRTNGMSTQVFGEFESVMLTVQKAIGNAYSKEGKAVFNLKVLKDPLPEDFEM